MSQRSLQRRLDALQAKRTPAVPVAIAWQDDGEPGVDVRRERGLVDVRGERMPLDEWHRRYPHGTLIRVVYGDETHRDIP